MSGFFPGEEFTQGVSPVASWGIRGNCDGIRAEEILACFELAHEVECDWAVVGDCCGDVGLFEKGEDCRMYITVFVEL